MSEENTQKPIIELEISPTDEVTIVGYKWLTEHGYGSQTTIWRKTKAKIFPTPIDDGQWTLAQIKRFISKKLSQATT